MPMQAIASRPVATSISVSPIQAQLRANRGLIIASAQFGIRAAPFPKLACTTG